MLWFKMDNEKLKILRLLIENKEHEFSIRQIAQKRKINYKSAYNAVSELEKRKIINIKKQGNISLCSFNMNFDEMVYTVEFRRRQDLLKNKNLHVLYKRLRNVNSQYILLLFGSYISAKQTKRSDIDLLLITDNPRDVQEEISLVPLKIHLTHINYNDFMDMLKSKELTVVSEVLKKNILLFGIEDYYRLVNNAK